MIITESQGVDWLLCNAKDTEAYSRSYSSKQIGVLKRDTPIAWWNVKGSKCKQAQKCKHKVPHNQSVSTCSDRAISSGHADHYLTAFWCSEGNLREARARLWLTVEEGKSRSKRAFSSTSPQNVNSATVCRPAGAFESFCPEQGRSSCPRTL